MSSKKVKRMDESSNEWDRAALFRVLELLPEHLRKRFKDKLYGHMKRIIDGYSMEDRGVPRTPAELEAEIRQIGEYADLHTGCSDGTFSDSLPGSWAADAAI